MEDKRIYSLDLLKFLCSVIVILLHLQQETGLGISAINLASGGIYTWYIVELFFLISGFLSMVSFSSPEKTKQTLENGFLSYFKHKCIRIYPMSILSIIFAVFCAALYRIYFGNWLHNLVPGLWRLLNSITLTNEGTVRYFNYPLWYLSVLLLCYWLEFFLIYLCRHLSLKVEYFFCFMILLGITGYCYGAKLPLLSYYTSRGYASFFIGCLIYKIYSNKSIKRKKILIYSIIAFLVCVLAWVINFDLFYDDETCQWGIAAFVLWPSTFIIFLELNRYFKSHFWGILGHVSFEMYLWHVPFITLYFIFCNMFPEICLSEMLQIVIFVIFMIIFSFFIYFFVEKPVTKKLIAWCESKKM